MLEYIGPISSFISSLNPSSIYGKIQQSLIKRRAAKKEKLNFISDFLFGGIDKYDRIVVEHAFEIYLGKQISFDEVSKILIMPNPLQLARRLVESRPYIIFNRKSNGFCYDDSIATDEKIKKQQRSQIGAYVIASSLATFLLVAKFIYMKEIPLAFVLIFSPLLFWVAYMALADNLRVDNAKFFMKIYSEQLGDAGLADVQSNKSTSEDALQVKDS